MKTEFFCAYCNRYKKIALLSDNPNNDKCIKCVKNVINKDHKKKKPNKRITKKHADNFVKEMERRGII